jgi:signal transduction histidine kinase
MQIRVIPSMVTPVAALGATLIRRVSTPLQALASRLGALLPSTDRMPQSEWRRRHSLIVLLVALHAAVVTVYGLFEGIEPLHAVSEGALLALFALGAAIIPGSRSVRASIASLGLLTASALLVHISGGLIEMHFHFFVMIAVVTLYQAWSPFVLAIAFVVAHHGVLGVMNPTAVYNHAEAWEHPWTWAGIHGLFVAAASLTGLANWRLEQSARAAVARAEADAARAQAAQDQAEARLQDRDQFLSIASHELLTPVTSLKGYAQLLRRRSLSGASLSTQDLAAGLTTIERQSHKLHRLVSQLLDRTRIETGHLRLDRTTTDLVTVLDDTVAASRIREDGRVIDVQGPTQLVGFVDPLRLEQVLINLIDNALKYSPSSTPVLVELAEASDGSAQIVVSDRGPGIPVSLREVIFTRFYRAAKTETVAGVGLGLFISHEIVALHGGRIDVEDRPGGGARFVVTLPLATDEESASVRVAPITGVATA